jgi:hypothetical protein
MEREHLEALLHVADETIAAHRQLIDRLRADTEELARTGQDARTAVAELEKQMLALSLYIKHRDQLAKDLK